MLFLKQLEDARQLGVLPNCPSPIGLERISGAGVAFKRELKGGGGIGVLVHQIKSGEQGVTSDADKLFVGFIDLWRRGWTLRWAAQ